MTTAIANSDLKEFENPLPESPQDLVDLLLVVPEGHAQTTLLDAQFPSLSPAKSDEVANLLKSKADFYLRNDINKSLNCGDLLFHIANLTKNDWFLALAYRIKANVFGHGGLGKFQEAIDLYDQAAAIYETYNHIINTAGTQFAKINPLIALGRYDEAFEIGKWAGPIFAKHEEWLLLAKMHVNLGIASRRLGMDEEALAHYDHAAKLYKTINTNGAISALARVEQNRSNVLRNLGRFTESIETVENAMAMHQASGQTAGVARAKQSLALTYFVLGRWNESLNLLDEVREAFFTDGRRRDAVLVDLYISDCLLQLRRFGDVLEKCDETKSLFAEFGTEFEVGQSILNRAIAFAGLNIHDQALASLSEARQCFAREGNDVWVASTDLETGVILLRQGKAAESYAKAMACIDVFAQRNLPVEQAQSYLVAAQASLVLGNYSQVQALITEALIATKRQNLPTITYQAHYLSGKIAVEQDNLESAKVEFDLAIKALETLRGRMMIEFRADFLEDKQAIYEDIVDICLALETPSEGLLYAERAKSRALLDLMALSLNVGVRARDAADQELVNELAYLRSERDTLYRRWAGNEATNERGSLSVDSGQEVAQQKILGLEKQITKLWHKLLIRNADYARDAALCQVTTEPVQPYLDQQTALIEFFVVRGQLIAFIVTQDEIQAMRLQVQLPQIQQLLQLIWLNLRSVPRSSIKQQIHSAGNMRGILQKMYKLLMLPLETCLAPYPNLIIVPHGPLHYLPFHALYVKDIPLLLQKEVSYLPSASFLRYCQEAKCSGTESVVLGHSYKGRLPNAVTEAQSVAQLLSSDALVEARATVTALQAAAPNGRILHLATHGDFRPDNPIFSGLALADSWLTTLDIFSLRLQASLVTLSACQTGRSVIGGGDELLGLMRALLSAGAASLVLSLWAVEDSSTACLMQEFYSELARGKSKREALRNAQRFLLEIKSAQHPQYTHPYYWAPFYLVGNTGNL